MKWEPHRTKPDFGPVDCSFIVACIFNSASEGSAMFLAGNVLCVAENIRRDRSRAAAGSLRLPATVPKGAMRGWPAAKKGAPGRRSDGDGATSRGPRLGGISESIITLYAGLM
jgi:hypothetical protein